MLSSYIETIKANVPAEIPQDTGVLETLSRTAFRAAIGFLRDPVLFPNQRINIIAQAVSQLLVRDNGLVYVKTPSEFQVPGFTVTHPLDENGVMLPEHFGLVHLPVDYASRSRHHPISTLGHVGSVFEFIRGYCAGFLTEGSVDSPQNTHHYRRGHALQAEIIHDLSSMAKKERIPRAVTGQLTPFQRTIINQNQRGFQGLLIEATQFPIPIPRMPRLTVPQIAEIANLEYQSFLPGSPINTIHHLTLDEALGPMQLSDGCRSPRDVELALRGIGSMLHVHALEAPDADTAPDQVPGSSQAVIIPIKGPPYIGDHRCARSKVVCRKNLELLGGITLDRRPE